MGNYYGSGTIIKKGKFSSFDPAADTEQETFNKTKKAKTRTKKSNNLNVKSVESDDRGRLNLLHYIIDRILKGTEQFKLPKNLSQNLIADINEAHGPQNWAKKQPEFANIFNNKQGISHRKFRAQEATLQKQREKQARMKLMKSLVDQILKNEFPLKYTVTESFLVNDIANYETITKWLNAQAEYYKLYQQRSRDIAKSALKAKKASTKTKIANTPPLTDSQIYALGKRRIAGENSDIPTEKLETLIKNLGLLPKQPPLKSITGIGKKSKKNRSKIKAKWISSMDTRQREAWSSLKPKYQNEYFVAGKVTLAFHKNASAVKPLNEASAEEIIKLNKKKNENWDYKKIDWDNT